MNFLRRIFGGRKSRRRKKRKTERAAGPDRLIWPPGLAGPAPEREEYRICPICGGSGYLNMKLHIDNDLGDALNPDLCLECNGVGYIPRLDAGETENYEQED